MFTKLVHPDGAPQPSPRSSHAAVCLDYNSPQLLVIGGRDDNKTLNDVWCLDVQAQSWQQVYFIIIVQLK